MVASDEEILKYMMDQNLFVIYEDLCLINVHEYKKKSYVKKTCNLRKALNFYKIIYKSSKLRWLR